MYYRDPVNSDRFVLTGLVVSALFHLLLTLLVLPRLEPIKSELPVQQAYPDSIQAHYPRFRYIPIELIETPEIVKEKKDDQLTPYVSDKSAQAADRYAKEDLPPGLPYSEGNSPRIVFQGGDGLPPGQSMAASLPTPPSAPPSGQNGEQQLAEASGRADKPYEGEGAIPWEQLRRKSSEEPADRFEPASQSYEPFSRDLLRGGRGGNRNFSQDGQFDNRNSSAGEFGDVSLSTYAWEWAPYIEYMRRRLREHLFPPPAFYAMGAISAEVRLRFRLQRNGAVEGLETLGYRGHPSLVQTSLNSVKASNPFKPLPDNFPEDMLEMVWTFYYDNKPPTRTY